VLEGAQRRGAVDEQGESVDLVATPQRRRRDEPFVEFGDMGETRRRRPCARRSPPLSTPSSARKNRRSPSEVTSIRRWGGTSSRYLARQSAE